MSQHEHHDNVSHGDIAAEPVSAPPLQIKPAPLRPRLAAAIVDSLIMVLIFASLGIVCQGICSVPYLSSTVMLLCFFVYYFVLEWIFGATIGKRLLRLIVMGKDGKRCSLGGSLKRNLLRFIDFVPAFYILGAVVILVTSDQQRLGDLLARTIVAKAPGK
jgi:uncharacterized RDD family membrane protein YckC